MRVRASASASVANVRLLLSRLPSAMVARLASIADGTKRLQVRVLRWSFFISHSSAHVTPDANPVAFNSFIVEGSHGCNAVLSALFQPT